MEVTKATGWRKPNADGYLVQLDSGNVARIRPVALDRLLKSGKIPDILTPAAAKSLFTDATDTDMGQVIEMADQMLDLVDFICKICFIEPKLVDDPKSDDEINVDDVEFEDKVLVFSLAIQPSRVLENFCNEQARNVELVSHSKDDKRKAK